MPNIINTNLVDFQLNNTDRLPSTELALSDGFYQYPDWLVCDSDGTTSAPSTQAYGVIEFEITKKDSSSSKIHIINSSDTSLVGYNIWLTTGEAIYLRRGAAVLFYTSSGFIEVDTNYRIRIERLVSGEFTLYIKGGSFGETYVLIDVTGGAGTNPVVDNTYTTSKRFVSDLDAGDKIREISTNETPIPLEDFTDGTGTYSIESGEQVVAPQFTLPVGAIHHKGANIYNLFNCYIKYPSEYPDIQVIEHDGTEFIDKQGNMQPVLNQVPVLEANGTDDKLTFNDLTGITIVDSEGTSTPTKNGNDIDLTAGNLYYLELSDGTKLTFGEHSDLKAWSSTNANHAVISGTGAHWTRADGIQSYNQANGFKLVKYDTDKEAYVPRNISDAEIEAEYTGVISIEDLEQDGYSLLADGSELNLHSEVNDTPLVYGDDIPRNWTIRTGSPIINGDVITFDAGEGQGVHQLNYWDVGATYKIKCRVSSYEGTGLIILPYSNSWPGEGGLIYRDGEYEYIYIPDEAIVKVFSYSSNSAIVEILSIQEVTTISDYLNSLPTPHDYQAGTALVAPYHYELDANKTSHISLNNPNEPTKFKIFDRADTEVFNDAARDSENFDSDNPTTFFGDEVNYNVLQGYYNPDYQQRNIPQLKANYCEPTQMGAQGVWATKKENAELGECLKWAKYICPSKNYALDNGNKIIDNKGDGFVLDS